MAKDPSRGSTGTCGMRGARWWRTDARQKRRLPRWPPRSRRPLRRWETCRDDLGTPWLHVVPRAPLALADGASVSTPVPAEPSAALVVRDEPATVLDVIARAASDPTVNVDKLERLLAIQERLLADQRKTAFYAALARLQARLPQILKSGQILDRDGQVRNRYAKIEDIDVAIRPLWAEEGFSFSFHQQGS